MNQQSIRRLKGIPILVIVLFLFVFLANSLSHDFFCHDELHTVCAPLHLTFIDLGSTPAQAVPPPSQMILSICLPEDKDIIPGFIGNVFHPPV